MQCLWSAVCARNRLRKAWLVVDYIDEHVVFVPKTTCSVWCRVRMWCALDWYVHGRTDGWRLRARVLSSRDVAGEFDRRSVDFVHRLCADLEVVRRVCVEHVVRICAGEHGCVAGTC